MSEVGQPARRRRSRIAATLVGAASIAALAIPAAASALGPGGWGNLGQRAGMSGFSALDGRADVLSTAIPGKLLAGGAFTAAGVPAGNTTDDDHIAIWDGMSWSALGAGAGLNGDVRALEFANGKIYAGGVFTNAGGNANADFLAVWDTTAVAPSWQPFCSPAPAFGGNVDALQVIGNTLYVGGAFQNGASLASADYLLACDLTSGAASSTVDLDGDGSGAIKALAADSNGDLHAGGNFINWDAIAAADYVAKYDLPGGTWSAMGPAAIDTTGVDSLATIGTDVYVGTDDVDVAGIAQADHVVKWNGVAWSAVGSNTAGTNGYFPTTADVQSLTTSGSTVFASGNWQNADGDPLSDSVARFNGTNWDNVGSNGALTDGPLNQNLNRGLAVFNDSLHVGGNFSDAGGDPLADSIACFPLGATPCIVSPAITIGKPKLNKRKGTAKLPVTVPGPGTLTLTGKDVVKQRPARNARGSTALAKPVAAAGTVKLLVKAKGKAKRKLNENGKVKVKVTITFTPTGGDPSSQTKRIKLRKAPDR